MNEVGKKKIGQRKKRKWQVERKRSLLFPVTTFNPMQSVDISQISLFRNPLWAKKAWHGNVAIQTL